MPNLLRAVFVVNKKQAALLAEEKMTEKQMYERALGAVERKRAELLRLKAERQRALAPASGEEAAAEDEAEAVDKEVSSVTRPEAKVAVGAEDPMTRLTSIGEAVAEAEAADVASEDPASKAEM